MRRTRSARGVASLLALTASTLSGTACEPAPPRTDGPPNVVLVTLDTTRADRLGVYGYTRGTSPNLDRLGAESIVYERAYSTSSWTLPTHASLFTGAFPRTHGALSNPKGALILSEAVGGDHNEVFRADPLAPDRGTLAELLADAGYETAGFVAGPWLLRMFGLDRGFDHWDERGANDEAGRVGADVSDAAIAWIDAHRHEPFFLFLNYFDPHQPYEDPEELWRRFATPRTPSDPTHPKRASVGYDGEILYMDGQLGRVLEHLRGLSLYDHSWVVVTGDHGELFGEHGVYGHGGGLYEGELRVPLIVKPPAGELAAASRTDEIVQVTDVFGLLASGLGLEAPGREAAPAAGSAFAEVYSTRRDGPGWRAWYEGDYKLLVAPSGKRQLYDLSRDSRETLDIVRYEPERLTSMTRALEAFTSALPTAVSRGTPREVDEQTRRALERLGYLE